MSFPDREKAIEAVKARLPGSDTGQSGESRRLWAENIVDALAAPSSAEPVQEGERAKRAEEALVLIHRNCVALANDDDPDVRAARHLALELDEDEDTEDEDAEQASGKGRPVQAAGERATAPNSGENLSVPAVCPVPATDPVRAAAKWRVGRKVGRTIYRQIGSEPSDGDCLIGVMDSVDLAAAAVDAYNGRAALAAEQEPVEVTDEMIERAAKAAWESLSRRHGQYGLRRWEYQEDDLRTRWREDTRAALSAALSEARTEDQSDG